jgi:hypothetical protein
MKIANIVHEEDLINHKKVDYINYYNEPKTLEEIDATLPTLYVGWSFMREINPDNELIQKADILKHKIVTNELYWEFSFTESKASHIKGVESFVSYAPEFYFKRYSYINLDPVFFQLKDLQDLLDVVPKKIDSVYRYKDEMIYLLNDKAITGIDLKMYEFFQFNISEMFSILSEKANELHVDLEGETYQFHYKTFPNFTHLKRYMVVLLTK